MNATGCCLRLLEVQGRESSRKSRKQMNNRGKRLIFHFHGFKNFYISFVFFGIFHHGNIHNSGLDGPINFKFSPFLFTIHNPEICEMNQKNVGCPIFQFLTHEHCRTGEKTKCYFGTRPLIP